MSKFEKEQKIFEISGIKIGGQPGEYPTVLIGSIFFDGDPLLINRSKGEFNRSKAEKQLNEVKELSEETGNPVFLDVVLDKSFEKFIDFVIETTEFPILIDSHSHEVRIKAAQYVSEVGVADRVIYNSLSPFTKEAELYKLQNTEINSAVLLCFNPRNPTDAGRIDVLRKLVKMAEIGGIEKILVDPGVLDLPDPGIAAKTIQAVKNGFGLPSGCAPHNAVDIWRKRVKMSEQEYILKSCTAAVFMIASGSDFVFYGPIAHSRFIFAACSLVDAYIGYAEKICDRRGPVTKEHPLYKIFRRD
jgi:tetrahydromethanopterin S-methyltransferase subunit H